MTAAWSEPKLSHSGRYYTVDDLILEPKPVTRRERQRPTIYAGGESDAGKKMIARQCDSYVMHGDPPERIAPKIADMRSLRDQASEALGVELPPLQFGVAGYAIVRDSHAEVREEISRITAVAPGTPGYGNYADWIANTRLDQRVSLEDYSVSNRGLRAGLVGTPEHVAARVEEFAAAGVDLLLLQCSPQMEEMERFSAQVMPQVMPRASSNVGGRLAGAVT